MWKMESKDVITMYEKIDKACEELAAILKEKNKKYGDSFSKTADEYGNAVLLLRIQDKLNRLKTLLLSSEKDDMNGENVIDTFVDLAGYAILSKIYLENKENEE